MKALLFALAAAAAIAGCGEKTGGGAAPAAAPAAPPAKTAAETFETMRRMAYAALDGGPAPDTLKSQDPPSQAEQEWFETSDPTWFTNSVGDKISVEAYAAACNTGAARDAIELYDKTLGKCDTAMAVRLVESVYKEHNPKREPEWAWIEECRLEDSKGGILKGKPGNRHVYRAWKVNDEMYLLVVDYSGRMSMRSYIYCMYDGTTAARLVQFEYPPYPKQTESALAARTDPAALNNIAAMLYNDEAEGRDFSREEYAESLLQMAACANEPVACLNLAFYYKESARRDKKPGLEAKSRKWLEYAKIAEERRAKHGKRAMARRPLLEWPER